MRERNEGTPVFLKKISDRNPAKIIPPTIANIAIVQTVVRVASD
jgi:hypothetical protein